MNEKEKLYEQYEDAFFAILMAEVAEAEGEKLLKLNESLLSDPNAAVPGTTSKRCLNIIKKNYKKDLRKKTLKHISYALSRVALVVMISVILFIGAFSVSATVRLNTLNFLIEQFDVGTAFFINNENASQQGATTEYLSAIKQLIPDRFELEICDEDSTSNSYLFRDPDGSEIEITGYRLSQISGTIVIDTEDADVRHETLHGQEVMIVHKGTTDQIVWINETEQTMTIVRGFNTQLDTLLPIAESIILLQE